MRGTIYYFRNVLNNKGYVGQSKEIDRRLKTHKAQKSNTLLSTAIGKYGIENFEVRILADHITTQEQLDNLEEMYILEYKTLVPDGYNIRTGRLDGVKDSRLTQEEEQQICSLYQENVPVKDISKMFNMSIGGIVKCLSRNNVPRRKPISKRGRHTKIDYSLLVSLIEQGKSYNEIAEVFNTNYKYIWKCVNQKLKQKNIISDPRETDSLEIG